MADTIVSADVEVNSAQSTALAALAAGSAASGSITFGPASGMTDGQKLFVPCGTLTAPKAAFLQARIGGTPGAVSPGYTGVTMTGLTDAQVADAVKTAIEAVTGHNLTITRTGARLDFAQLSPGAHGNGTISTSFGGASVSGFTGGGTVGTDVSALSLSPRTAYDSMRVGPEGKSLVWDAKPGNVHWRANSFHHPVITDDQNLAFMCGILPTGTDGGLTSFALEKPGFGGIQHSFEPAYDYDDGLGLVDEWLHQYLNSDGTTWVRAMTHLHYRTTGNMTWGWFGDNSAVMMLGVDSAGVYARKKLDVTGVISATAAVGAAWAGGSFRSLDSSSGMMLALGNDTVANVGGFIIGGSVCNVAWLRNMTYLYSKHAAGITIDCEVANAPLMIGTTAARKIGFHGVAATAQQVLAADPTPAQISTVLSTLGLTRTTA